MRQKAYTTAEAAKKIGITRQALYDWIKDGKVAAPKPIMLGKRTMRVWTINDIEKAKRFKGTLQVGRPKTRRGGAK